MIAAVANTEKPSSDVSINAPSTASRAILQRQHAQQQWAATPVRQRLAILKRARHRMAAEPQRFADAISPALARTPADTLATELMPLLDACRFLERNADALLRPRLLGDQGRPFWLRGVTAEVRRDPFGHILVIGPTNFPLFLPGVQVMQALAAGNSVTWKPGTGGAPVAHLFADALFASGLLPSLLTITADTVAASELALAQAPNKVIFTGSAQAGKDVLALLALSTTPAVVELSGADAVIVLPGADLPRVARALAFGLRLNGGAVCMSPRRLLALGDTMTALLPLLERELEAVPAVAIPGGTAARLRTLLDQAVATGARLRGDLNPAAQRPILVTSALPTMPITHADIFAPVLSLMTVSTVPKFPDVYAECPYALTAAIFGPEQASLDLAGQLRAGTVLINDLIAPTADPRIPFTGRDASGFGATRGPEGLLEMTAPKAVLIQRSRKPRHYDPTGPPHAPFFAAAIRATHGATWLQRLSALRHVAKIAMKL